MNGQVIDIDGNPLAGIRVSDGSTVVRTAADGMFRLETESPLVFVVRPAGWRCDRWYVDGGESTASFILQASPTSLPLRFAHLTDTHIGDGDSYPQPAELGTGERLAALLSRIVEAQPDLHSAIITGDLTDHGLREQYREFREAVSNAPVPVHVIPGNHDHMVEETSDVVSRNGYAIHTGEPRHYEEFLGPRWYSYDLPGLHVVAIDWFTHEVGQDHEQQNAWLRADLAALDEDIPWILLSHDQPGSSILAGLPRPPIATFSGHRHTSRVLRTADTLHVNTPPALFGGVDLSPATYRLITWDGATIGVETLPTDPDPSQASAALLPAAADAAGWRRRVGTPGQRAPFALSDGVIALPLADDDRAAGGLSAVDAATGELLWHADLDAPVRSAPVVHAASGTVLCTSVSGTTAAFELSTGRELWRRGAPDPLRLFGFTPPTVHGDLVLVGDHSALRALDIGDGHTRWERRDIAPYQIFVLLTAPAFWERSAADGASTLIVWSGFPEPRTPILLDPVTGETIGESSAEYDADLLESLRGSSALPIRTPLVEAATGDLIATGITGVFRRSAEAETLRWFLASTVPWNPTPPQWTSGGILFADAGGSVSLIDAAGGELRWRTEVSARSGACLLTYRRSPHPLFAAPTVLDEQIVLPALDGDIVTLGLEDGAVRSRFPTGVPILVPVRRFEDIAVVLHADGTLCAYPCALVQGGES
ncbi:MAG: PQQ-binding-like beta-propeller repeat protein [Leucobacter sp.]